jgi:hypothetical protein
MAHNRSRSGRPGKDRRRLTKQFPLFSSNISLGWREIYLVSYTKGENNVARGIWRRVNSQLSEHIGYQIMCTDNCGLDFSSNSSPTYISAAEMMLYAGRAFKHGGSRTAGLDEEQRAARRGEWGKILPMEDAVERVTGKVEIWTTPASRVAADERAPYGDKAVRVYPRAQ